MSKMKELYTEQTTIQFDTAECVECGVEIEFADESEFAKLVSAHACVRMPS
jgi:ferredoxin-like protein FixX